MTDKPLAEKMLNKITKSVIRTGFQEKKECGECSNNFHNISEVGGGNADKPATDNRFEELSLQAHTSLSRGIRYPCDICEKSYSEKSKLKRHSSTHHEPPHEFDMETKLDSDIFIMDNDVKDIETETK
ncbi:hypothetical protein JTB14_007298 [Gonioctena quinquepunctata]|nr:hypothetical protein JTB14_007298 [Gonioctena quinquepunctata]